MSLSGTVKSGQMTPYGWVYIGEFFIPESKFALIKKNMVDPSLRNRRRSVRTEYDPWRVGDVFVIYPPEEGYLGASINRELSFDFGKTTTWTVLSVDSDTMTLQAEEDGGEQMRFRAEELDYAAHAGVLHVLARGLRSRLKRRR